MIAEAYILFLAFQDKLLSEGHYYVFLKEEQRRPGKCFTTLSWGGGTGNGLFQGFPRAFLGLEQAGSPHLTCLALRGTLVFLGGLAHAKYTKHLTGCGNRRCLVSFMS